jgi:hypothetical protein
VSVVPNSVRAAVSRNRINLIVSPDFGHIAPVNLGKSSVHLMRGEASGKSGSVYDVQEISDCVEILGLVGRFSQLLSFFVDESIPQILRHRIGHKRTLWDALLIRPHELADQFHWVGLIHLIFVSVG